MLNEEFLLPWWLHHHKTIFDHGIIFIDATRQTDSSVEIIKEICPTWETRNIYAKWADTGAFEPYIIDAGKNIKGWRIYLTGTEFLVGDINSLTDVREQKVYQIPTDFFFEWNPNGSLDKKRPLWSQFKMAEKLPICRHFSNIPIEYGGGLHCLEPNTNLATIFKYSNAIACPEMLHRRMSFQNNFSPEYMKTDSGWQHHNFGRGLWPEMLEEYYQQHVPSLVDESELIAKHAAFHIGLIRA
jgi:hypothetical protein